MSIHYRFLHPCGHTGIGPAIHTTTPQLAPPSSSSFSAPLPDEPITSITLPLSFPCPFCTSRQNPHNIYTGQGLLCIISSNPSNPFPTFWNILRSCTYSEIIPADWSLAHQPGGYYRQMAWIPRPRGGVEVIEEMEEFRREGRVERGVVRQATERWRQRVGQEGQFESRFAGLWSRLNAAVWKGEGIEG